ncbi:unannotated protein [freshwater metagenome]|uniref:Unannotated protein n=1 Tax=freshwater metagenome TaxID=449393 RepID=A0A6J7APJ7_9ZZZZ
MHPAGHRLADNPKAWIADHRHPGVGHHNYGATRGGDIYKFNRTFALIGIVVGKYAPRNLYPERRDEAAQAAGVLGGYDIGST